MRLRPWTKPPEPNLDFLVAATTSDTSPRNPKAKSKAGGVTRQEETLSPHVVPAELAERIGHEFRGHAFAPGHVEIRVVQRLGDTRGQHRHCSEGILAQRPARQESRRFSCHEP